MSSPFARKVIQSKNKVKIDGVTNTNNQCIPRYILQKEIQNQKIVHKQRDTVKVALLNVDITIKD